MPTLLAYLPCDKVIIEEGTKTVSINSVLETIHVVLPRGAPPPPPNTAIAMNWMIYQLWQKAEGDTGEFESKSVLTDPNGQELLAAGPVRWQFTQTARYQIIVKVGGFPIWTPGTCHLKLMLKSAAETDFREVLDVVLNLKHEEE